MGLSSTTTWGLQVLRRGQRPAKVTRNDAGAEKKADVGNEGSDIRVRNSRAPSGRWHQKGQRHIIGRKVNRVFGLSEDGFTLTRMVPYMVEGEFPRFNTSRSGMVYGRSCTRFGGSNGHPLCAQETLLAPSRYRRTLIEVQSVKERRRAEIRGKFSGSSVGKERDAEGCLGVPQGHRVCLRRLGAGRSSYARLNNEQRREPSACERGDEGVEELRAGAAYVAPTRDSLI